MPNRLNNRTTLLTKRSLTIEQFLGLDRANGRFGVSQNRATDEANYYYKDGVLQKREGYEEIVNAKPFTYKALSFLGEKGTDVKTASEFPFNGAWAFKDSSEKEHVVAHLGKFLFELKKYLDGTFDIAPILIDGEWAYEFEDYRSQAFIGNHCLWFLGGNQYVRVSYDGDRAEIVPVKEIAYVPTTTDSITSADSAVAQRLNLDSVNMLTEWRKNRLLTGTVTGSTVRTKKYYEYTLDSSVSPEKASDLAKIRVTMEYMKQGGK